MSFVIKLGNRNIATQLYSQDLEKEVAQKALEVEELGRKLKNAKTRYESTFQKKDQEKLRNFDQILKQL